MCRDSALCLCGAEAWLFRLAGSKTESMQAHYFRTARCDSLCRQQLRESILQSPLSDVLLQHILPAKTYNATKALALSAGVAVLGVIMVLVVGYVMASPTFGWTGLPALHHFSLKQHAPTVCFMCIAVCSHVLKRLLATCICAGPCEL